MRWLLGKKANKHESFRNDGTLQPCQYDRLSRTKSFCIDSGNDGKQQTAHPGNCEEWSAATEVFEGFPLAASINNYSRPGLPCYDKKISATLRALRPDWFRQPLIGNRQEILDFARSNENLPPDKSKLRRAFYYLTCKSSPGYDAGFTLTLTNLVPQWFLSRKETKHALDKMARARLIALARSKKARPFWSSALGIKLNKLTNQNQLSYEAEFHATLLRLCPNWFSRTLEPNSDKHKQQLLDMARAGLDRPVYMKDLLGSVLINYTGPSTDSYDPDFNSEIKALRPDWFKRTYLIKTLKKFD